jgi:hypothetical protein
MQTYSPFFQTLYDQPEPVGYLGRGTHYSVLRATVFHDAFGQRLSDAMHHDFAVVWDEDHDIRVIEMIDRIYRAGLLPGHIIFGERKGMLTAVMSGEYSAPAFVKLKEFASMATGDSWDATMCGIDDPNIPIVNAPIEDVHLYLRNIKMLWRLGSHPVV